MALMLETESEAAGGMTWGDWRVLIDQARDAALTLAMAADSTVHEDYRPTAAEVENARELMSLWRAVCARPLPEMGPQVVSRTASARMRVHRAPTVRTWAPLPRRAEVDVTAGVWPV